MSFDVVVIGAGHAGVEAAHAAAKLGSTTLLLTIDINSVAHMPCNPSIGGTAKGHLVCEIDALGGLMGVLADKTALQIRMLNMGKGAAVRSLRSQNDRVAYHKLAKKMLSALPNLTIMQGEVVSINENFTLKLSTGEEIRAKSVIIAAGVYLNSKIRVGDKERSGGPSGFASAQKLGKSLQDLGITTKRFMTTSPPRLDSATIDFSKAEVQHGDDGIMSFSQLSQKPVENKIACHITHTNPATHKIIRRGVGVQQECEATPRPRYCPSIEDKIRNFPERDRHQLFLEPETITGNEIYVQGLFTALDRDIQQEFVQTITGLEKARINCFGYGIKYDCIDATQLRPTLEHKTIPNLFFAGQINGTSGYEEAAAQGLVAGINAASNSSFIPGRTQSYIGVLIDDIVTKETDEPYRMMTGRAEHRLHLRQDNADIRLTPIGRKLGLVCDKRWRIFQKKTKQIQAVRAALSPALIARIKRGEEPLGNIAKELGLFKDIPPAVLDYVETEIRYEGYLVREAARIKEAARQEEKQIPSTLDYFKIEGLSAEGKEKLNKIHPLTIGQAGRISGVSPADINVLIVWLRKHSRN